MWFVLYVVNPLCEEKSFLWDILPLYKMFIEGGWTSDRDERKRLKPIVNSFHVGHFYIFTGDITMFAYNRVETEVT